MRYLLRIILILITLILLAPIVFAVDSITRDKLFTEARLLCMNYGYLCKPMESVDTKYMWGQTDNQNNIRLSTALLNRMTEEQVRGVLYHEVGHVVFQHSPKTIDYLSMCGRNCDPKVVSEMRRRYEYQADRFACYVSIFTHRPVDLEGALLILTPPDRLYKTEPTHPSTADRIKEIRRIMNGQ